ncbi:MAG: GMC family oxidoreductase [Acidimicrobiia bacterium]|nr:GMC family oxidoreductase [Acidimicrobiia bacterium]
MFGLGPKHLMRKWGSRLLHVGVMGIDGMDGRVTLGPGGVPTVSFDTDARTRAMWAAAKAGFRHVIEDGAGGRMLPSWEEIRDDSFTIHPLGTCRMATSPELGVVRHDGAVWKAGGGVHEGLYVMDTSTFSAPIGVNTSLTAAAVAERACDLMVSAGV